MADGESRAVDRRNSRTLAWLLGLYCLLSIAMLQSPVDAEFSFLASIPPFAAVLGAAVATSITLTVRKSPVASSRGRR